MVNTCIIAIKEVRRRAKEVPMNELAQLLNVTERTVRRFLSGENMLQVETFLVLANHFGMELKDGPVQCTNGSSREYKAGKQS